MSSLVIVTTQFPPKKEQTIQNQIVAECHKCEAGPKMAYALTVQIVENYGQCFVQIHKLFKARKEFNQPS